MRMLITGALVVLSITLAAQDTVTLKNGEKVEGKILDVTNEYFLMRIEGGKLEKLRKRDVKEFSLKTFLATVLLEDGSRMRGRGVFETLEVETAYGRLSVPVSDVKGFVTEHLRLRIFKERAEDSFRTLLEAWEKHTEAQKEGKGIKDKWRKFVGIGAIRGQNFGRVATVKEGKITIPEDARRDLIQLFRFIADDVKRRIEETRNEEERKFWQRLRDEALAVEPYVLEEGDLIVTEKFDILGKVLLKTFRLETPYGVVSVPFDGLLAVSFGITPSLSKVVELKPSADFVSTGLTVKAGDEVDVRATGTLNMRGFTVTPEGGNLYGRQTKGVEMKIGDKVIEVGNGKKFRAPTDGTILLRFDLSAFRWIALNEIEGSIRVTVTVCGTGIPLPEPEKPKETESRGERIKRLLYGLEK